MEPRRTVMSSRSKDQVQNGSTRLLLCLSSIHRIAVLDFFNEIDMHFLTAAVTSSLILYVSAAPQPLAAGNSPRAPDPCGPEVQIPGDPRNSCGEPPAIVTSPSSYGILGQSDEYKGSGTHPNWSACNQTIATACARLAAVDTAAGQWYFQTGAYNSPNEGDGACQIGFWLPRDNLDPQNPLSNPKAAVKPSQPQCESTLSAVVEAAEAGYPKKDWVRASVNLVKFPSAQPGQWRGIASNELPGGEGTGAQVNGGYPSYVLALWRGAVAPLAKCLDENGAQCVCAGDDATCSPYYTVAAAGYPVV
ncbi:MAG: hypothetical protein LQ346_002487 [Caloplaca aetnensis]|nr:MAG: hypothetical protein LQ346_002487 [Caloplaca aetnensis]